MHGHAHVRAARFGQGHVADSTSPEAAGGFAGRPPLPALMKCDDITLLQRWAVEWSDLIEFEIVPVVEGKETGAALSQSN